MVTKIDYCGLPVARNCDFTKATDTIRWLAILPPAPINIFVNEDEDDILDGQAAAQIAYYLAKSPVTKWLIKRNVHLWIQKYS